VPNCSSNPSAVNCRVGGAITPALFTKMSRAGYAAIIRSEKAATEARLARSNISKLVTAALASRRSRASAASPSALSPHGGRADTLASL